MPGSSTFSTSEREEKELISIIKKITNLLQKKGIPFCFFGSIATSGYIGSLIRPHSNDIDLIVSPGKIDIAAAIIKEESLEEKASLQNTKAGIRSFIMNKTKEKYMRIDLYSGKYAILNVKDPLLKPIARYHFKESLSNPTRKKIKGLESEESAEIPLVRIEDLIISKLFPHEFPFPALEDLHILLSKIKEDDLDMVYLNKKFAPIRHLCVPQLENYKKYYEKIIWNQLQDSKFEIQNRINILSVIVV